MREGHLTLGEDLALSTPLILSPKFRLVWIRSIIRIKVGSWLHIKGWFCSVRMELNLQCKLPELNTNTFLLSIALVLIRAQICFNSNWNLWNFSGSFSPRNGVDPALFQHLTPITRWEEQKKLRRRRGAENRKQRTCVICVTVKKFGNILLGDFRDDRDDSWPRRHRWFQIHRSSHLWWSERRINDEWSSNNHFWWEWRHVKWKNTTIIIARINK